MERHVIIEIGLPINNDLDDIVYGRIPYHG